MFQIIIWKTLLKCKPDCVISLLKSFQWLPMSSRTESEVFLWKLRFCMTWLLASLHLESFFSWFSRWLILLQWHPWPKFPSNRGSISIFLPQGFCTCYSLPEYSSSRYSHCSPLHLIQIFPPQRERFWTPYLKWDSPSLLSCSTLFLPIP